MSNFQRGYGKAIPASSALDALRASKSAIDQGAVILIEAGLAHWRVLAHRLARKALADERGVVIFRGTYIAIIEWLRDEYLAGNIQ